MVTRMVSSSSSSSSSILHNILFLAVILSLLLLCLTLTSANHDGPRFPADNYYLQTLGLECHTGNAYNPVYGGEAHNNFRIKDTVLSEDQKAIKVTADLRTTGRAAVTGEWTTVLSKDLRAYRGAKCYMDVMAEGGEALAAGPCELNTDANGGAEFVLNLEEPLPHVIGGPSFTNYHVAVEFAVNADDVGICVAELSDHFHIPNQRRVAAQARLVTKVSAKSPAGDAAQSVPAPAGLVAKYESIQAVRADVNANTGAFKAAARLDRTTTIPGANAASPCDAAITADVSVTTIDGKPVDALDIPVALSSAPTERSTCMRIDVTFRGPGASGGGLTSASESAGAKWKADPYLLFRGATRSNGAAPSDYPSLHRLWLWDAETIDTAIAPNSYLAELMPELCSMEGVYDGHAEANNEGPLTGRKFSALYRAFNGGWKLVTAVAPGGETDDTASLAFPFWMQGGCGTPGKVSNDTSCGAGQGDVPLLMEEIMASESRSCALGTTWCAKDVAAEPGCSSNSVSVQSKGSTASTSTSSTTTTTTSTSASAGGEATTTTTTTTKATGTTSSTTAASSPSPVSVPINVFNPSPSSAPTTYTPAPAAEVTTTAGSSSKSSARATSRALALVMAGMAGVYLRLLI